MNAFNLNHLIREVPGGAWRDYLAARNIQVSTDFDWMADEVGLAAALREQFRCIEDPERRAAVHAELRRVHTLGSSSGVWAMRNASKNPPEVQEAFEQLANHAERALWMLLHRPDDFHIAERMLRFDHGVRKRGWKRHAIKVTEPVSREAVDQQALQAALSQFMTRRNGPRRICWVESHDRFLDGGVQISVYIEDDPNDELEVIHEDMRRRTRRPVDNFALVYYPMTGLIDSIGRGGSRIHVGVIKLFAAHLLKRDVQPEAVKQPLFHLNRLRYGFNFPGDAEFSLADHGVDCLQLRRARFESTTPPRGRVTIEMPAAADGADAYAFSQTHLRSEDLFRPDMNLIEVVIGVYHFPTEPGKQGHAFAIELKHTGVSNLQHLAEADAQLAETLLNVMRVSEPLNLDVKLAA